MHLNNQSFDFYLYEYTYTYIHLNITLPKQTVCICVRWKIDWNFIYTVFVIDTWTMRLRLKRIQEEQVIRGLRDYEFSTNVLLYLRSNFDCVQEKERYRVLD